MFPTLVEMFDITGLSMHVHFITRNTKQLYYHGIDFAEYVVTYKISYMSEPC